MTYHFDQSYPKARLDLYIIQRVKFHLGLWYNEFALFAQLIPPQTVQEGKWQWADGGRLQRAQ